MKKPRAKDEYDFGRARRGAVVPAPGGKTRITIRIDTGILDWFRKQVHAAGGGNYQTLMNEALGRHIDQKEKTLEDTLRVSLHEVAVREEAGGPHFCVHHEVSWRCPHLLAGLPLRGCRAQHFGSRHLQLVRDILWGVTIQDIRECRVATAEEGL